MKQTILRNMIILTLIAVIISSVASVIVVHGLHFEQIRADLHSDAQFILALLRESASLEEILDSRILEVSNARITIVSAGGKVLYDNRVPAAEMENHQERDEIKAAQEQGEAEARRFSSTLGINTLYYAIRLNDDMIIRFAKATPSFINTLYRMLSLIFLLIGSVVIIAIWLGEKMADSIITPINNLDLNNPLENDVYQELSPLLTRIHRQKRRIDHQMQALEDQQKQFQTITNNMTEGLMLLDHRAIILYTNLSALQILGGENHRDISEILGRNLWTFNRDLNLRRVVDNSLKGNYGQTTLALNNQRYQISVSPVAGQGKAYGAIIIVANVTQKYEHEQMRKEFTGNVSHELKTPLTAISSYAELLKDGLVKSEDVENFAARIYEEAKRMIILVEDLLKLSQLDERIEIRPKEKVDLHELALEVTDQLITFAEERNVELAVKGEPLEVMGDAGILFEMIYNLVHNAIKYNKPVGGSVTINCQKANGKAILKVSDTGIGIPEKHHARIFERFYRVDESHSRKTGGTGLGLSIVKNATAYHDATLTFESTEKIGTTITVSF